MSQTEIITTTIQEYAEIINITIQRKISQKNTYIRIKDKNNILITTNTRSSDKYINNLIKEKETWLAKHLNKYKERVYKKQENIIYYQGNKYTLQYNNSQEEILIQDSIIYARDITQLNNFLHHKANKKLNIITKHWSRIMSLTPNIITIKKTKSQWGSCSRDNNISFNSELIKLPLELIDYIVVHELAHITHKNHSNNFWLLVQEYLPNHKALRKDLRAWEKLLRETL